MVSLPFGRKKQAKKRRGPNMAYPVLKEKKPKSIDVSPDLGNPQPRDVSSSPFVPGGLNSRVSRCPAMMEKCGCGADPLGAATV
eukprot:s82_g13.t3